MNFSSKYIEEAVNEFSRLPGIGKRTALRLVLHLLNEQNATVKRFTQAIDDLVEHTQECAICHYICDDTVCSICENVLRKQGVVCVVESLREVMAIENTSQYNGVYHVLGGVISPMNGVGPDQINLTSLFKRIEENDIEELIMALNPTIDGDTTIFYISKQIQERFPHIKVTTLARGVSFGGELEYVDELTLARSIETRRPFDNYLTTD